MVVAVSYRSTSILIAVVMIHRLTRVLFLIFLSSFIRTRGSAVRLVPESQSAHNLPCLCSVSASPLYDILFGRKLPCPLSVCHRCCPLVAPSLTTRLPSKQELRWLLTRKPLAFILGFLSRNISVVFVLSESGSRE